MSYQLPYGKPPVETFKYDEIWEMSDAIVDEVEAHGVPFTDDAYAACGIGRGIMLALAAPEYATALIYNRFGISGERFAQRLDEFRQWIADRPISIEQAAQ